MTDGRDRHEPGPGLLESSIVVGGALLVAAVILVFFGGTLADALVTLMDAAHGGR